MNFEKKKPPPSEFANSLSDLLSYDGEGDSLTRVRNNANNVSTMVSEAKAAELAEAHAQRSLRDLQPPEPGKYSYFLICCLLRHSDFFLVFTRDLYEVECNSVFVLTFS